MGKPAVASILPTEAFPTVSTLRQSRTKIVSVDNVSPSSLLKSVFHGVRSKPQVHTTTASRLKLPPRDAHCVTPKLAVPR